MAGYYNIKLNFENIPKKYNHFSWIESIGKIVPYQIENTEYCGILTISNFIKPYKIVFKKDDEETVYTTSTQSFCNGKIYFAFGKECRKYKYNIGDIILDRSTVLDKILIDKQHKNYKTKVVGYRLKCLKDNYEYDIEENVLNTLTKNGTVGCPACASRIVIPEVNSLAALLPDIIDWFEDKTIPYKTPRFSNEEFEIKCPYCGTKKKIRPMNLKDHIPCICGDGFSYPEKLFAALLNQLNIDYIYQLSKKHFEWCEKYKFDFYFVIDNQEYIIELDGGLGHKNGRILDPNSLNRDKEKNRIAKEKKINLIRIDVNYSDINTRFEYIKTNIINKLSNIFCFDNVNWKDVEYRSEKSLFQTIIDMFNDTDALPTDIAKDIKIDSCTVVRYLNKGNELGICNYNPNDSQYKYIQKVKKDENIIHKNFILLKVEKENFYHIHKTISDFSKKSKSILGFNISERQILRILQNPEIKNRHHVKFSYATKEEYEDYINKKAS